MYATRDMSKGVQDSSQHRATRPQSEGGEAAESESKSDRGWGEPRGQDRQGRAEPTSDRYEPRGQDRQGRAEPTSDRYEPLPGIAEFPKWAWRKLPRAGRVAVGLLPFVVVALVLLLAPGIDQSKDERAQAERERLARLTAERAERIRIEQRPRFRSGPPAGRDVAARSQLVAGLPAAIQADARQRVAAGALAGPVRSVECEPYPRSVEGRGAHLDPQERTGRYSCLAVTREVRPTETNEGAVIGHPYRVLVNFDTGRYAFCKVSGRPGEGSLQREILVPVPPACGGR
jgi:hypothetical protein